MPDSAAASLTNEQIKVLKALQGRDFLRLHDYSSAEVDALLSLAEVLKKAGRTPALAGKILGMLFMKPSTRTRVSFEVGMLRLGGTAVVLNANETQINRGEAMRDTARVLSRYVDGIMVRTFAHSDIEELAKYASVPVVNGLTDSCHPCQALADLLTIREKKGLLKGLRLVYVGDGNNMAHSLLVAGAKTGMHVTVCCPPGYEPKKEYLEMAQADALPGTELSVQHNPIMAAANADILYTDVWASMGQESERAERLQAFAGYQINEYLLEQAAPDSLVLHCLPAHRGEEITDTVIEGDHSAVFDQAENRLHAQNAVLVALMGAIATVR